MSSFSGKASNHEDYDCRLAARERRLVARRLRRVHTSVLLLQLSRRLSLCASLRLFLPPLLLPLFFRSLLLQRPFVFLPLLLQHLFLLPFIFLPLLPPLLPTA